MKKTIITAIISLLPLITYASTGEEGTTSNPNCDSNCLSGINMSVANNTTTGTQNTTNKGFYYYTGNSCSGYNLMNNFSDGHQTLRESLSASCGWPPPPPPPVVPSAPPVIVPPVISGDPPPPIIPVPPPIIEPPVISGDPPPPIIPVLISEPPAPPSFGGCGGGGVSYPVYATDWDGNMIDPPTVIGSWSDSGCPGGL